MVTLLLVRHATTIANEEGLWIGHMESEISSKGKAELKKLKKRLSYWQIEKCFVSPSQRTLDTVSATVDSFIPIEQVEELREIDFGRFEGKSFKWAKEHVPEEIQKMIEEGDDYFYPEGESLKTAHQRMKGWLTGWLGSKPEGTYMICAHGGTIRSILSELVVHDERLHWHFKVDPASLSIVTLEEGFATIDALNQR